MFNNALTSNYDWQVSSDVQAKFMELQAFIVRLNLHFCHIKKIYFE